MLSTGTAPPGHRRLRQRARLTSASARASPTARAGGATSDHHAGRHHAAVGHQLVLGRRPLTTALHRRRHDHGRRQDPDLRDSAPPAPPTRSTSPAPSPTCWRAIDTASGAPARPPPSAAAASSLHTGTINSTLSITSSSNSAALTALGLTAGVTPQPRPSPSLTGKTLTIAATGGGTATSITFGTGAGQVSTLNELNTALAPTICRPPSTPPADHRHDDNNAASSTIGAITGTATGAGQAFAG